MSDPVNELLHDIPEEYRERVAALLGEPPVSLGTLTREVDDYLVTVRKVAKVVTFIDVDEAERIGRSARALIAHAATSQQTGHLAMIQAAAHYFVFEDDDEEITGVLGFDDDIQVLNAVCRAVGRSDLVIPLKRRSL